MSRFDAFWRVMCDYTQYLWLGVMGMLFLFFLAVFSIYFAQPGTASYTLALFDMALIVVFGSLMGGMFWVCHNRRQNPF